MCEGPALMPVRILDGSARDTARAWRALKAAKPGYFCAPPMIATRILVIEDNEIERTGLVSVLGKEGFQVVGVPNGQEALDQLQTQPTDVILLDMLMPNVDGWHFLQMQQADPQLSNIPVVVVTGLAVATDDWAQELGASGLVKKPIETEQLVQKLRTLGGAA
jgi:twitching motility two-component system response regulator PilH